MEVEDSLCQPLDADQLYNKSICLVFSSMIEILEALVHVFGVSCEGHLFHNKSGADIQLVLSSTRKLCQRTYTELKYQTPSSALFSSFVLDTGSSARTKGR